MGMSLKQIRYLYAIGVFKGKPGSPKTAKAPFTRASKVVKPKADTKTDKKPPAVELTNEMRAADEFKKHLKKAGSLERALKTMPPHVEALIERELPGSKVGFTKNLKGFMENYERMEKYSASPGEDEEFKVARFMGTLSEMKSSYNRAQKKAAKDASAVGKMDKLDSTEDLSKFPKGMPFAEAEKFIKTGMTSQEQIVKKEPKFRQAFDTYQRGDFEAMNGAARKSGPLKGKYKADIEALDEAFQHATPLKQDLLAFRGVSKSFSDKLIEQHRQGKLLGSSLSGGFVSTTLDAGTAAQFASPDYQYAPLSQRGFTIEIAVPKGSKPIHLEGRESELLFDRKSKLEIVGVDVKEKRLFTRLRSEK